MAPAVCSRRSAATMGDCDGRVAANASPDGGAACENATKRRINMLILALVPILAWHITLLPQDAARRSGIEPYRVEWENDDVRIARVVLAPGEHARAEAPAGSVIVYLTANLDGRMPSADATWQAAGPFDMENH